MLTLSIIIPLCGYFSLFFINNEGNKLIPWFLTSIILTIGSIFSIINVVDSLSWEVPKIINLFNFLNLGEFKESFSLKFLYSSCFISFIIYILSLFIILFCLPYMEYKENINILLRNILLLVFTMLLLINTDNILLILFTYELQSICIYIAINFTYKRYRSNQAGFISLVMNLLADAFICGATVIIFTGKENFEQISILLVILGSLIKGGQLGFSIWVSKTMEAPSPISALLNGLVIPLSSIILLIYFLPLSKFGFYSDFVIFIGVLGALGGAIVACLQHEVKKILAYSTISQIGLMFIAIGQGSIYPVLLLFALHGAAKILLFLSYAEVIRAMSGEHDIRHFGGVGKTLKFSCLACFCGSIAIILTTASAISVLTNYWLILSIVLTSFFTGVYLFRPWFWIFFGSLKGEEILLARLKRESLLSISSIIGLLLITIFASFYFFHTDDTATSYYLLLTSLIGFLSIGYGFKKDLSFRDYLEFSWPRFYQFLKDGFGSEVFYTQTFPLMVINLSKEISHIPYKYFQLIQKTFYYLKINISALNFNINKDHTTLNIFIVIISLVITIGLSLIILGL